MALFAIALLMANARCINNCAFRSCSDFIQHHTTGSQPPCHHKAPSSNHSGTDHPCSHQILPGSQAGVSAQPVVPRISAVAVIFVNTPAAFPAMFGVAFEFHSPPRQADPNRTAVLRI